MFGSFYVLCFLMFGPVIYTMCINNGARNFAILTNFKIDQLCNFFFVHPKICPETLWSRSKLVVPLLAYSATRAFQDKFPGVQKKVAQLIHFKIS